MWCRAYDCRSVSVGLIFPPFPVGWSSGASLSGFDGPIEGPHGVRLWSLPSHLFQSLRHPASVAGKCKKRAHATGRISEKLDFAVPALAWPAFAV